MNTSTEHFNPAEYNEFKHILTPHNSSMAMMRRRLGDLASQEQDWNESFVVDKLDSNIDGLYNNSLRLIANGGHFQQDRMILDKKRSLDRAVMYSYQGAEIRKITNPDSKYESSTVDNIKPIRALINPDKNKQDYDDKIISVSHDYGMHPGDIFEWIGTKSYWLIYLQDLTEVAYFKGEIRRCSYEIEWDDENGRHKTYAAIRGPVETQINFIQKHTISVDEPNYSLNILMPKNEATLNYFRRYSKFYLKGTDEGSQKVCWRVEGIDWISTPGILEVVAEEYYINRSEDNVEDGIVGDLIIKPNDPNETDESSVSIEGDTFIKPKKTYVYKYIGSTNKNAAWSVPKTAPIKIVSNGTTVQIQWTSNYSGQFELSYGDITKTIVVESLF